MQLMSNASLVDLLAISSNLQHKSSEEPEWPGGKWRWHQLVVRCCLNKPVRGINHTFC